MAASSFLLAFKGLMFLSTFMMIGFITSEKLRSAMKTDYIHAGNINEVGWTKLMGGQAQSRNKRHALDGDPETSTSFEDLTQYPTGFEEFPTWTSETNEDTTGGLLTGMMFGGSFNTPEASTGIESNSQTEMTSYPAKGFTTVGPTTTKSATTEVTTTEIPATTEVLYPFRITLPPDDLNRCQREPYELHRVCNLSVEQTMVVGTNFTLDELADFIFDLDIMSEMSDGCENGTWCLGDEYDLYLWYERSNFIPFCQLDVCLMDIPDDCLTPERRMAINTLQMMCRAHEYNVTSPCLLSLHRMSHVAMVNMYKLRDPYLAERVCGPDYYDKCEGPCQKLSHQLECMRETCGNETDWFIFEYPSWEWLFGESRTMKHCDLDSVNCTTWAPAHWTYDDDEESNISWIVVTKFKAMDAKLMTGLATSLLITICGVVALIWACVRRIKRANYSRDNVQYSEVKFSDDTNRAA